MITLIVEAILAVLLVTIVMQFFKKRSAPPSGPQPDLSNLKAADARTGDVISITAAGDEMSDLSFTADRTAWYQAGQRRWSEVSGAYRERRVAMRVMTTEDDVEVFVHNDPRKLTIEDFGLSESDLGDLDERQNTSDWFDYENKSWLYRLSREVQSSSDGAGPSSFYYWEFREKDGKGLLAFRKAEGEPFVATLYTGVSPGDVTVYRSGKA